MSLQTLPQRQTGEADAAKLPPYPELDEPLVLNERIAERQLKRGRLRIAVRIHDKLFRMGLLNATDRIIEEKPLPEITAKQSQQLKRTVESVRPSRLRPEPLWPMRVEAAT